MVLPGGIVRCRALGGPSAVLHLPAQGTPAEGLHEEGADLGQALPGAANW